MGQLFCLEVFCGTAGITAELRAKGMKASLGIDHTRCKGGRAPILRLDLTKETDQHRLLDLLEIPELVFVWIAPPCGTASLARAIRFKDGSGPPELRTMDWPDGVPWAEEQYMPRLEAANQLYRFTQQIALECLRLGIPFYCGKSQNQLVLGNQFLEDSS